MIKNQPDIVIKKVSKIKQKKIIVKVGEVLERTLKNIR